MNRILMVSVGLVLVVIVLGCDSTKKRRMDEAAQTQPAVVPLQEVVPTPAEGEPMSVGPTTKPKVEKVIPDEPVEPLVAREVRIHVVQPGDTLYKLARKYYGDQRFWRKIWQANLDKVPDPNTIKVGEELVIPEN